MPKFRKRPVIVDAEQWFPDKPVEGVVEPDPNTGFEPHVITLEGSRPVFPGDWVVTGVAGDRSVVKNEIFKLAYEPCGDEALAAWEQACNPEVYKT